MTSKRPGGELASRPLHFIWMADCSGSMSVDGKIQSLNTAIHEALPHMRQVADENPNASVLVRALKFSHGAKWHVPDPTPLQDLKWHDLEAYLLPNRTDADIIFLMDISGSMGDEIKAVKRSCVDFADHIIKKGANVQLGLIGFSIGGHRRQKPANYTIHNLSRYTIGIWPLTTPAAFKANIQSLSLGLFGGRGCYLANRDTVDIFPHVVRAFGKQSGANQSQMFGFAGAETGERSKILVIISDEIGHTDGLSDIVSRLKQANITTYVLGVPGYSGAHESIASMTGGKFWDIERSKGVQDFSQLLDSVAQTIATEITKKLASGIVSAGTDMGTALQEVAKQLKTPPMPMRALPPVLVLISDGQPTDDFLGGLNALMEQPWGKKAVRIAIAIGNDADLTVLQKFIGHSELEPLQANNPEELVTYIKWASTAVLKSASASAPASQAQYLTTKKLNLPLPALPEVQSDPTTATEVW